MQGSAQYILFELNGQSFAIAADCVREIIRLDATYPKPWPPRLCEG